MREIDDLLPCPFCDGPCLYEGDDHLGYEVVCQHCRGKGGWGDYGYQAQERWNRRPFASPSKVSPPDNVDDEGDLGGSRE